MNLARLVEATACVATFVGCTDGSSVVGSTSDAGAAEVAVNIDAPPSCTGTQTACNDACVNTAVDPSNCGACGMACPSGQVCTMGRCELRCPTGQSLCDGRCVDTATRNDHCGACGMTCTVPNTAAAACVEGSCAVGTCAGGFADCDGNANNGCETNTQTSTAHCGGCNIACSGTCSNGTCVASSRVFQAPFSASVSVLNDACNRYRTWRASLTPASYTFISINGTANNTTITCTNPAAVQQIAAGLRTLTDFSVACDGRTWTLCSRYEGEFWIDPPSLCSGSNCPSPGTLIRPCFNLGGGTNFNGVQNATCPGPDQTITITVR